MEDMEVSAHSLLMHSNAKEGERLPAMPKIKESLPTVPAKEEKKRSLETYMKRFKISDRSSGAGWITAGQMGINAVAMLGDMIDPAKNKQTRIMGLNTDAGQLVGFLEEALEKAGENGNLAAWLDEEERFEIIQLGEDGGGAGGDPEVAAELFDQSAADKVEKFAEGLDIGIVAGGFGGGTGSGVVPKVAEILAKHEELGTLAIGTMPLEFEGPKRMERAEKARRDTSRHIPVLTIYNQAIYQLEGLPHYEELKEELRGKDVEKDFDEAIRLINKHVLRPHMQIAEQLMSATRAIFRRDPKDRLRLLKGAKAVFANSYEFDDPNVNAIDHIEKVLARLLEDPFQHDQIVPSSNAALVLLRGSFSTDEVDVLVGGIKQRMNTAVKEAEAGDNSASVAESLELIVGVDQTSAEKAILVMAVSPVLPDSKSRAAKTPRAAGRKAESAAPAPASSKEVKHEEMNPFHKLNLDDLRARYKGRMRQIKLKFREDAEPVMVSLSPRAYELVQYFEFNAGKWNQSELEKNYNFLAIFFREIHPMTEGKTWVPEGLEKLAAGVPKVTEEQRKNFFGWQTPPKKKK